MNDQALLRRAQAVAPWAVDMRRRLHRVPEIANREFKTQALIVRALDELGIEHREAGTGVLGLIRGAASGPAIALRADIDALPVTEPAGPFRSQHEGMMHACGHDAHTAIALGAGRLLHEAREHLAGDVRLIFQPAEEGPCGAADMIAAGALSDPPVAAVYGLHVMPHLPFGAIETRAGALNAACDTLTLRIVGRSGHGAYPERNADAIVCAAQVISAMQTLVSRNVGPTESAVLSFGVVRGGTAHNIIAGEVELVGTLRTLSPALRALAFRRVREIAEGVCAALGCRAELTIDEGYMALINGREGARRVLDIAARLLGPDRAIERDAPSMGAEDFAYYLEKVPGAFYHLGCADPDGEWPAPPLHNERFTVDERCFPAGIAMQAALALAHIGKGGD